MINYTVIYYIIFIVYIRIIYVYRARGTTGTRLFSAVSDRCAFGAGSCAQLCAGSCAHVVIQKRQENREQRK